MDKYETMTEYMLIKIYVRIKNNTIFTIINIKAYMSVITKLLVQVLKLKWILLFKKDVISIDKKF